MATLSEIESSSSSSNESTDNELSDNELTASSTNSSDSESEYKIVFQKLSKKRKAKIHDIKSTDKSKINSDSDQEYQSSKKRKTQKTEVKRNNTSQRRTKFERPKRNISKSNLQLNLSSNLETSRLLGKCIDKSVMAHLKPEQLMTMNNMLKIHISQVDSSTNHVELDKTLPVVALVHSMLANSEQTNFKRVLILTPGNSLDVPALPRTN